MKIDWEATAVKSGIIVCVFALLSFWQALIFSLVLTWGYQYPIAFLLGYKVMPTMDTVCLIGPSTSNVNFISVTQIDQADISEPKETFAKLVRKFPKLNYGLKKILGDFYYYRLPYDVVDAFVVQKVP